MTILSKCTAKADQKRGLIYQVLRETSRDHDVVGGKKVSLLLGMSVTGEINIRRYTNEALRER